MVSSGANKKTRKKGVFGSRIGKSYEELHNFDILSFLGGGLESHTSGGSSMKTTPKSGMREFGISDGVSTKSKTYVGISYDIFTKFPLFSPSRTPHYKLYDLPTNMGIVRTRSRQIDACDNKIKSHRKDMKSFKKSDSRRGDKIKTRQRWIKELTERKKRLKHEMDYRQKLLKEISKHLDISNKGSIRKPNGSVGQYRFRIYWWGKRQEVYLGSPSDMKSMFSRSTKFDDFDEFLKDLGRKRFLQRFGSDETNVRKAQRRLRRMKK